MQDRKKRRKKTFYTKFWKRLLLLIVPGTIAGLDLMAHIFIFPTLIIKHGSLERHGEAGTLSDRVFQYFTSANVLDNQDACNETVCYTFVTHNELVEDEDGQRYVSSMSRYVSDRRPMLMVQTKVPEEEMTEYQRYLSNGRTIDEISNRAEYYYVQSDIIEERYAAIAFRDEPYDVPTGGLVICRMQDAYIKDDICIPGKYCLLPTGIDGYSVTYKEYYDETPADTEGYTHIVESDDVSLYFMYYGSSPDSTLRDEIEALNPYLRTPNGEVEFRDDQTCLELPKNCKLETKTLDFAFPADMDLPLLLPGAEDHTYNHGMIDPALRRPESEYHVAIYRITRLDKQRFWEWELSMMRSEPGAVREFLCTATIVPALLAALWSSLSLLRYQRKEMQRQKEEYRVTLTNTLAHDLKTPLAAISGYAENLVDDLYPEKREYYSERILENTGYMDKLIADVLELSKMEQNKKKPRVDLIDLSGLFRDVLNEAEPELVARGIKVEKTIRALPMRGNTVMVEQMARNLVENVVKYAVDGGRVMLGCTGKELYLTNLTREKLPDDLSTLLEPFVKGDKSRSRRNGNGLGLAIVKVLAEQQGIKLRLQMTGDTFEVILRPKRRR